MSETMTGARTSSTGTLIVVCGLPGSGKTTHARRLCEDGAGMRFSPDEWMASLSLDLWDEERREGIEALQWELAQELLGLGGRVVIEWGTWGRSERDALRLGARALGARAELHYLRASLDVLHQRIRRRNMESPSIARADLEEWMDAFQEPTAHELALFDEGRVLDQG